MAEGIRLWRDENGVAHVAAADLPGLCRGLGYAHAADRALPMLLMRILGQGRGCELLADDEDMLAADRFFRRMNWAGTGGGGGRLSPEGRLCLAKYCQGVNDRLGERFPWELRLLGVRPAPWRPADSLLIMRMTGYLTLSQSQAEIERLLVEMVQAGVDRTRLEELFPGLLEELDTDLLRRVALGERIVPAAAAWQSAAVRMMASNNWVVSAERSASGRPLLANDPHLETNRLPNIWYEVVLETPRRCMMGGTLPGVPGVLAGRNDDLAWGVTYAFADTVDSWVERCRQGRFFREDDGWRRFRERKETIRRRKHPDVEAVFHENGHGVLDGDPHRDARLLATRWAAADSGPASLDGLLALWNASDVRTGMRILRGIETDWSFVLADSRGEIGFQMSGRVPRRRKGRGLVPLPGWVAENDWDGFLDPADLPCALNPPEGFFVTANQDLNRWGKKAAINMPMGAYRAERIGRLLAGTGRLDDSDMRRIQLDLYSVQAESFMAHLRPLLPDTAAGRVLSEWDLCYGTGSRGAALFETFYRRLRREVFGRGGMGGRVVGHLTDETGVFVDFYRNFDRVMLSPASAWFDGRSREAVYRRALEAALRTPAGSWGASNTMVMRHILLGGKLPRFLGFDRGPLPVAGGRATPCQGQIYRSAGRETSFMPSLRLVADMADNRLQTALAGGPSDRRFSRWYVSGLADWRAGRYKRLAPGGRAHPFP